MLPAIFQQGQDEPVIIRDLFLYKKSLVVKQAWQIGEHDDDVVVLQVDDEPIIPKDIKGAPVLAALERKKKLMRIK